MKTKVTYLPRLALLALLTISIGSTAKATFIINISPMGSDVATGSGSIDLSGLTYSSTGANGGAYILPNDEPGAGILLGPISSSTEGDFYSASDLSGPDLNSGSSMDFATSGSGDPVGFSCFLGSLFVPAGCTSGAALSGTST
jgi:hypothetical protein